MRDLLVTQVWLGLPAGLLAAALAVRSAERAASGAEWHPLVRRRQVVDQRARDRKATRLLTGLKGADKLPVPPLGIVLDGDLPSWVQGRYLVPPAQLRGKGMAVIGAPGAGKTVTLLRLAYLAGCQGVKVCFADCKGTDPNLAPSLIAAYRLGNPTASVGQWPQTAMDAWRGDPSQVQSRLMAVEQFSEPFYKRVASAALRLAVSAPDGPPIRSSQELLERLDADRLAELWDGHDLQMHEVRSVAEHLPGARLRYGDFFAALGGAFDYGTWSFEDVDLAVLTVPTLLSKAEADAAMRIVLEDYGHYAVGRKPRTGEDAMLVLDEFSAMASGVDAAINLLERLRDVGAKVIAAAQSFQGFGDEHQADRLLASCAGGIIVHQCPDPERILRRAGVVRELEQSWNLNEYGPRGLAEIRMGERPRVDAEQVRAAYPGEAWIIQAGRAVHLRVLPPPRPEPTPAEPAGVVRLSDRRSGLQARPGASGRAAAAVATTWTRSRRALAIGWQVARRRLAALGGPR